MRYTDYEQRLMDQASGRELDATAERLGPCKSCGHSWHAHHAGRGVGGQFDPTPGCNESCGCHGYVSLRKP